MTSAGFPRPSGMFPVIGASSIGAWTDCDRRARPSGARPRAPMPVSSVATAPDAVGVLRRIGATPRARVGLTAAAAGAGGVLIGALAAGAAPEFALSAVTAAVGAAAAIFRPALGVGALAFIAPLGLAIRIGGV